MPLMPLRLEPIRLDLDLLLVAAVAVTVRFGSVRGIGYRAKAKGENGENGREHK